MQSARFVFPSAALLAAAIPAMFLPASQAEVRFELNLGHSSYGSYYATAELSATNPVPITYHRVVSPSGTVWKHAGSDDSGNSGGDTMTNDLSALVNDCTNGLWSLTLNVGDATETQYMFSVSMDGVASNTFGEAVISNPLNGSTITDNPPTVRWTGPSSLPSLFVMVRDDAYTNYEYHRPPSTDTNWTPTITLTPGPNNALVNYESYDHAGYAFGTPTNTVGGTPLPGWDATGGIASYAYSFFTVTNAPPPPSSLAEALDATYLPWTTGGDADWFGQTTETHDGKDAAQSGSVAYQESSWIETTVTNEGILTFWWKIDADEDDYLELEIDGSPYERIYWDEGWEWFEDWVDAGTILRWTFHNDDNTGGGQDAAFLDQMAFGSPLAMALDAPELPWTIGGDGDWSEQYDETWDGYDAAMGEATAFESAWIETEAIGPGTLSFHWAIFADPGDQLVFEFNGSSEDWIEEEQDWSGVEINLEPGTNTLRWTFYNDDDTGAGMDAGFLDAVVYTPSSEASYEAEMAMSIQRGTEGSSETYSVYTYFGEYAPTSATIEVESPNGLVSGGQWSTSSALFDSLQEAIDECEAGPWTIYFNRGEPDEKRYAFGVSIPSLTTNDMPPVAVLSPLHGATGATPQPGYSWTGPASYSYINTHLYSFAESRYIGHSWFPPDTTSWTNAPTVPDGTNRFNVAYTLSDYPGISISEPLDDESNPLAHWVVSKDLISRGRSIFVVGGPVPVTILPLEFAGGNLVLSFASQSGTIHFVEYCTNLVDGSWMPATNFPGDGATNQIALPTTNPAAYYHILTQ